MEIAARSPAARHAVSSLGLAALAVSALVHARTTAAPATEIELGDIVNEPSPAWTAVIRELTVIGSPEHAEMTWAMQSFATEFARCATSGARVTIYAHFEGGIVTDLDAYGRDTAANECALHAIAKLTVPVLDVMDVMIPIDFAPAGS